MQQRRIQLTGATPLSRGPRSAAAASGGGGKQVQGRDRQHRLTELVLQVMMGVICLMIIIAYIIIPSSLSTSSSSSSKTASSSTTTTSRREEESPFSGKPRPKLLPPLGPDGSSEVEYHIIFSTGCTLYQDWQSYIFFYQAMIINQPGTVTRIASGCDEETQQTLQHLFDEQIKPMAPDRFKIHFTPDYSTILKPGISYVYFNKPLGTKHWMEHVLGYPDKPVNDNAIVILLDPDQMIMRPFENNDFSNTVWKFLDENEKPRVRIEHGKPMGQLYGFGLQWKDKATMEHVAPNELPSPVDSLSREEARKSYIVGPPYVATARDMYAIATKWSEFVPRVHDQYPFLLAEMFAYCLAAAHLKLPHQTAASFMISDVGSRNGEGWGYVDDLSEICAKPEDYPMDHLPNVLHFCQRYMWGPYFFGKRRLPKDFLTCESPLLAEPPMDLLTKYTEASLPEGNKQQFKLEDARENVFTLCYIIPSINRAAAYFKRNHCEPGKANMSKTLMFTKDLKVLENGEAVVLPQKN